MNEMKSGRCMLGKTDESWLWHKRMGHINFDHLVKVSKKNADRHMPKLENLQIHFVKSALKESKQGSDSRQKNIQLPNP